MDEVEVRKHWEANAEAWTVMSRQRYDRSRDMFNTPAFMQMMPDVAGLEGRAPVRLGCGRTVSARTPPYLKRQAR